MTFTMYTLIESNYSMEKIMKKLFTALTLFGAVAISAAHHEMGHADHEHMGNSADWQIEAYSSAAPAFIGNSATIIGASGKVLRSGSNGWTCQSGNPRPIPENGWKNAHEAMATCHDDEGTKWMMGYMSGTKPNMDRDSYMWMLNGDMGEDNTTAGVINKKDAAPGQWIESGPHLMLMPKNPSSLDNFSTDFTTGAPYVMFAGTDYAHLMIPVEGYYKYQPESAPK